VKSSIGMGMLLCRASATRIRVSLSADPVEEIKVGYDMLKSLGLRRRGVTVISCPSCARQNFDVIKTVGILEERLAHITTPLTLSVIGCVVNGPGEARETDIGFTARQRHASGLSQRRAGAPAQGSECRRPPRRPRREKAARSSAKLAAAESELEPAQ